MNAKEFLFRARYVLWNVVLARMSGNSMSKLFVQRYWIFWKVFIRLKLCNFYVFCINFITKFSQETTFKISPNNLKLTLATKRKLIVIAFRSNSSKPKLNLINYSIHNSVASFGNKIYLISRVSFFFALSLRFHSLTDITAGVLMTSIDIMSSSLSTINNSLSFLKELFSQLIELLFVRPRKELSCNRKFEINNKTIRDLHATDRLLIYLQLRKTFLLHNESTLRKKVK